jgi:hypothetical protein
MKKGDAVCIGDIYGKMLNPLRHSLRESKNKNAFGDQPELKGKGPHTDGYNNALNDDKDNCDEDEESLPKETKRQSTVKKLDDKLKNSKLSDEQKKRIKKQKDSMTAEEAEEEKFIKENRKNIISMVNSSMSKSVFDKLYNKVLKENFGQEDNDVDALGLDDSTPDSDFGDEFGDDEFGDEGEGDSVTFTLDRATAQTLIDVLQGAIGEGGEEDFGDEGDDLDFGDEGDDDMGGDDDFGGDFEEDEETQGTKPAVDKKKAFQGKSNKVSGPPSPKSGKAKTDVTDEVGTKDGAPSFSALQGKNNQVPGSTLKKATDYFK